MEKDREVASDDYDFGDRIYDGRLGKWVSVDRQTSDYPSISPYVFAINSPLIFVDPNGRWVAKVVSENGKYRLSFVAEENDNLSTLAMQLGIKADALKKLDPTLEGTLNDLKSGTEISLEALKSVQRINRVLNLKADKIKTFNCASLAAACSKGFSINDQYKTDLSPATNMSGNTTNNVPAMMDQLVWLKESGIEEAQLGSIILYKPDNDPKLFEESIQNMVQADIEKKRQEFISNGKSKEDVDKLIATYTSKNGKELYENNKKLLEGEQHFAVLILKDKTGSKVNGIIQKQGQSQFQKDVLSESSATSGSIKYVRDSKNDDKTKSFYTPKNNN